MIPCIILAGGFGKRLRDAIGETPKPMAPIGETTFIDYQIGNLVSRGISNFIFTLHYKAEHLKSYLGKINKIYHPQSRFEYVIEDKPLGTGGAIKNALNKLQIQDNVLVTNADTWVSGGINKLLFSKENTIALSQNRNTNRYGRVEMEKNGLIRKFYEKDETNLPGLVSVGIYHLDVNPIRGFSKHSFSLENDYFPELVKAKKLFGLDIKAEFIDIGVPREYSEFKNLINEGKIK